MGLILVRLLNWLSHLETTCEPRTSEETCIKRYGTKFASQNEKVKVKTSNTLTSKSDDEKREIELKKQETCLKNHGVTHAQKNKEICDRMRVSQKQTMIDKYGVDHPCKVKEIQDRSEVTRKATMLERYGVIGPMQVAEFAAKANKTNLEKYGVEWQVQREDFNRFQKYTSIHEKVYEYLVLLNVNPINELRIGIYSFDIYVSEYNILIEINGDYWHANPLIYEADFIVCNTTASDIWDKDERKRLLAVNKGYNTLTLWENQILDDSYINIINQYLQINKENQ